MPTLFPLHGALLVTNPREDHMAIALSNPRPMTAARVARYAKAKGISLEKAWAEAGFQKGSSKGSRGAKSASAAFKKFFFVRGPKGSFKAKIKSGKFGAAKSRGGHASQADINKAMNAYGKIVDVKVGRGQRRKAIVSQGKRISRRGSVTRMAPQASMLQRRISNVITRGGRKNADKAKLAQLKAAGTDISKLKALAKSLKVSGMDVSLQRQAKYLSIKDAQRARALKRGFGKGARKAKAPKRGRSSGGVDPRLADIKSAHRRFARTNGLALTNGRYGALALQNSGIALPMWAQGSVMDSLKGSVVNYAPVVIVGAVVGAAAHAILVPWAEKGLEAIGAPEFITDRPYLSTGTVALLGSAALGSAMLHSKSDAARKAGAGVIAVGAAAFSVGVIIDLTPGVIAKVQEWTPAFLKPANDGADMDLSVQETIGAIGLSGLGIEEFGAIGLGDGGLWETAPLSAEYAGLFSQAELGDALHCSSDFSGSEGECLLAGPAAFVETFGRPAHRMNPNTSAGVSHFAGAPGHRWGWLVKMFGWQKASAIAALPPKKRLPVLKAMRAAAIQAGRAQMQAEQQADAASASVLASSEGAQGLSSMPSATGAIGLGAGIFGDSALSGALFV